MYCLRNRRRDDEWSGEWTGDRIYVQERSMPHDEWKVGPGVWARHWELGIGGAETHFCASEIAHRLLSSFLRKF